MFTKRAIAVAVVVGVAGCGSVPLGGRDGAQSVDDSKILKGSPGLPGSANVILKVRTTDDFVPGFEDVHPLIEHEASVELTSAFLVLDSIKLFRRGGGPHRFDDWGHQSSALVLKGPFIADLMDDTITSAVSPDERAADPSGRRHRARRNRVIAGLEIPEGTYHRFKIRVAPLSPEDAPSPDHPLVGLSASAAGTINGVPFEYCGTFEANMEYRTDEGIKVSGNDVTNLALTLNPRDWFSDLINLITPSEPPTEVPIDPPLADGPCDGTALCSQWATAVLDFSSQYSSSAWSAEQALDEPNTMAYGDSIRAWAPRPKNGPPEFITLAFDVPVHASGVAVRETWGNGFVTRVDALDESGTSQTVWEGVDPSEPGSPVEFLMNFPQTDVPVHAVTVHVDPDHNPDT